MAYDEDIDSTHNPASGLTIPSSWGDIVNANFAAMGAWTSFSPTWENTSTSPAIGNGSLAGQYQRRADFGVFRIKLVVGSTTTFGTGTYWSFTLPYTLNSTAVDVNIWGIYKDASVKAYGVYGETINTTEFRLWNMASDALVNHSAPVASPAATDYLTMTGIISL